MDATGGGTAASTLPAGTVTLLLADLEGSVRLWEADRDAMASAIGRLNELIDGAIRRHGGVRPVEQGGGDSFVGAFARATDAVCCALGLQLDMQAEHWNGGLDLRFRMAVHTGEAEQRDEGNYAGAFINRCARLRDTAHGGQVLLSRATHDLVVDRLPEGTTVLPLGAHRLRDLARPEDIFQLAHPSLPPEFPPIRSLDALPNNLPVQLTSFIGRESEIADIRALLASNRMLTLTGAGGAGKTRLALHVAADLLEDHPDGVWWIDLAPVADPTLVATAVAGVLSVSETPFQPLAETIVTRLRDKRILLLIDNCEHLVSSCAELATLIMRRCPTIAIIATSREPLGVEGEVAWRIPSLTLPLLKEASAVEALTQYEAVRLFIDRALRVRPNFTVTNETAPAVAEICHRLDGIPLAIELAAARVRLLTPAQITAGLDDRFRLLTGGTRTAMPRQQTLEASVDWSYDLLSDDERRLLGRLSVFAGSFMLDAAEAVCSGDGIEHAAVLDLLSHLVDRSLVQVEDALPAARYRLLETIRQYGRRKLAGSGEANALRDRHLAFFVEWAGPGIPMWGPEGVVAAIQRHEIEIENVRAALDWAEASGRTDDALRLACALTWMWWSNRGAEGRRRFESILAMENGVPLLRVTARLAIAQCCWTLGDPFTGRQVADEAFAAASALADRRLMGRALFIRGWHEVLSSVATAGESLERAIELLPDGDDYRTIAETGAAAALFMNGDWVIARRRLAEVAARSRATQDIAAELVTLFLATVTAYQADFAEALVVLDEALAFGLRLGELTPTTGIAWAFRGLVHSLMGERDIAEEAISTAISIGTEGGLPWVEWVARWFRGGVEYFDGNYAGARAILEEVLPLITAFNARLMGPLCLASLAETVRAQGDTEVARARARELTEIARASGVGPVHGAATLASARIAMLDDDLEKADDLAHESLAEHVRCEARQLIVDSLETVADVAARQESHREAARVLGAAQSARDVLGYRSRWAPDLHEAALSSVRKSLGQEEFETAWTEGLAMSLDEAVAYAARGRGERKRPTAGWASLTPTELDVVRLVAEGLTNKQIGERLFVAPSTVKVHVKHIFGKLGLSTRSELAAQATRRQL